MNLKELANLLNISQTTVSRALNGYPEVSEKTRLRIIEAAKKHNYTANASAKGLATGKSMTIGHVLTDDGNEMVNPVFGDFLSGVSKVAKKMGYDILITQAKLGEEEATYKNLVAKNRVDGVILQSPIAGDARIDFLKKLALPFVVHGRVGDVIDGYSWVDINNKSAFERATKLLIDLGHQRIALINGNEAMDFAQRRRVGYLSALEAAGISANAEFMHSDKMTERYGHRASQKLLQCANPPTAFLVSSLISAIGVRRAIHEAGLKIGKDISVITHDDELSYLSNGDDVPIFTATRSSVFEAGKKATELLIDQIVNPDIEPKNILLEAQLVLGKSTAPNTSE